MYILLHAFIILYIIIFATTNTLKQDRNLKPSSIEKTMTRDDARQTYVLYKIYGRNILAYIKLYDTTFCALAAGLKNKNSSTCFCLLLYLPVGDNLKFIHSHNTRVTNNNLL